MLLNKYVLAITCCVLLTTLTAQIRPDQYDARWKVVDSLVNKKGLTQSALEQVNKIYTSAKNEKNNAQLIRALVYRMNLQSVTQESAMQKNIGELEKEIVSAKEPTRSILSSMLASLYLDFLNQNRYQLFSRTKTIGFKKEDLATWDAADLHKRIGELFLTSVREEGLLWQTKLDSFAPIIIKGNVRNLRPTLFDLLAHRALDYFKSDERDLIKPAYSFEITDPMALAGLNDFANYAFRSVDSPSMHFRALQLFQRLMIRHMPDAALAPMVDLDLERIRFVYQYAVMEDKEALYEKALSQITDRYDRTGQSSGIPGVAEAWYLQAELYANRAAGYNPLEDTSNRYGYVQAKAICEKVIAAKDSSEGKTNCQNLLKTILRKSLVIETERINIPGQALRSLLSWNNFSKAWFRVLRMDRTLKESLGNNTWQDEYWKNLLKLPALRTFSQTLPETGDHQTHRVEIKIDALPAGEYALVASADPDFSLGKNLVAVQYFYVSSISLINYKNDYFVLNRESGQPLAAAAVQVWNQEYDYKSSRYKLIKTDAYQTDQHGHFLLKGKDRNQGNQDELIEVSTAGDHFFPDNGVTNFYSRNGAADEPDHGDDEKKYEKTYLNTFFFTDRSIYRPGQTVYFKGIVVTRDFSTKQPKILPQFSTKLILYDANNQKVDSLLLTTNDYGSYHGQFSLPEHLLNGEFRVEDDSTKMQQSFSVEEYKRPKFYVDFEKLKGSYRPGDTIRVTGAAKAYAGNPLDGAVVKYRVARIDRFPYTGPFRRTDNSRAGEWDIAHGEALTKADGSFSIVFAALPNKKIRKEQDPVFEYKVTADITDINGETHNGQTMIPVGYKALRLTIGLPSEAHLPADSLKELAVRTSNLSGEPVPAAVTIDLFKLKVPDRLIRQRYWSEPDQFVMSREEWVAAFPHDAYGSEGKIQSKDREPLPVASIPLQPDSLQPGLSAKKLSGLSFKPGWYMIEARTTDKYGQEVKESHYLELYDGRTGQPAYPAYQWASAQEEILEPGAKAIVKLGSSAGGLFVIRKVETSPEHRRADDDGFGFLTLDKDRKSTEFSVTESDRGGFTVSDIFVKDNRSYLFRHRVIVPWTNKDLAINYASFRDKTLPGSEEKWRVKISGHKGDKVAAELVTGMYDASLDAFRMQEWSKPALYPSFTASGGWNTFNNFYSVQSAQKYENEYVVNRFSKIYDRLLVYSPSQMIRIRGMNVAGGGGRIMNADPGSNMLYRNAEKESADQVVIGYSTERKMKLPNPETQEPGTAHPSPESFPVQVRKNFAETAFFFPDLQTDSAGNASFSFTMPEALTKWKWMTLAHTKDLAFAYSERSVITSKQLMVQPNAPRFLREGDRMELSVKIVNLTDSELTGQMELQLTDPATDQSVDGWFSNRQANQYFTVGARQSSSVEFAIEIPYQYNRPVKYRILAKASNYSDGEEAILPVVSNRMLVTESLPLNLPGNGVRNFQFDKLLKSAGSETLNHHALTVEFSSNPAWYAVQALPYLMEYPYECAEQTFDRFYANALATRIINNSPRIRQIFEKWKTADTAALLSNLEKNPELKSVLLEETPWVLQAKSESQQKKNIALLFDMARMSRELESSLQKLGDMQAPNGGFVWFKGGMDDRYITQVILTGIGRLQKLNALPDAFSDKINALADSALPYLDKKIKEDFENLKKNNKAVPLGQQGAAAINPIQVQYLYMRSFFGDRGIPGDVFPAVNYYRKQAQQSWLQNGKYLQGMIALALQRTGDPRTAKDIVASLRQNAIRDEEKGMYWKDLRGGYYWHQAPIEAQSLLIEAFREIAPDAAVDRDLKTWLLRQKQTQNWATTKATADACYALLAGGQDWLSQERTVSIRLGEKVVSSGGTAAEAGMGAEAGTKAEAGTGYFKKIFDGPFVSPSMGNISVTMSSAGGAGKGGPAWGAVYWQYFENLDRITPPDAGTAPLKLNKKIFIEKNTDRGPVLEPVSENGVLHVGDKLKIRIELRSDRDLEYVHMKDMRASCTEPVNVLSGYKWQGGLGYYESTKDVSTDFFFSWVPRGTYVFEYPVFVAQNGNFSNGVTSIECMYAPEFSFHSEGIRVNVEKVNP